MRVTYMECCGIREIDELEGNGSAQEAMREFASLISSAKDRFVRGDRFRYAIFSATRGRRYGPEFAAYITDNRLGTVISTKSNINPNTGNRLKVWVWTVDHTALKRWSKVNE